MFSCTWNQGHIGDRPQKLKRLGERAVVRPRSFKKVNHEPYSSLTRVNKVDQIHRLKDAYTSCILYDQDSLKVSSNSLRLALARSAHALKNTLNRLRSLLLPHGINWLRAWKLSSRELSYQVKHTLEYLLATSSCNIHQKGWSLKSVTGVASATSLSSEDHNFWAFSSFTLSEACLLYSSSKRKVLSLVSFPHTFPSLRTSGEFSPVWSNQRFELYPFYFQAAREHLFYLASIRISSSFF